MSGSQNKKVIHKAAGVCKLAYLIGDSQSFKPSLPRTTMERVLSVDAVMDVARVVFQTGPCGAQHTDGDDTEAVRAEEYFFLATLLARAPDVVRLSRIATFSGGATPLGLAHLALARAAENASFVKIEREFFNLFIGTGRGNLPPYGSRYLSASPNERSQARLRNDLRALNTETVEEQLQPEDHAAILCEIMGGLVGNRLATAAKKQQQFFETHLGSRIERFFAELERADAADFYRHVGTVGRLFVESETEFFTMFACKNAWED
jgi:TorA maturation chaperone TorD